MRNAAIKLFTQMNFFGSRRRHTALSKFVAIVVSFAVAITGMVAPAQSASADDEVLTDVPAQLTVANWGETSADLGGGAAPLSNVKLAPGGTAVWGANITAGTNDLNHPLLRLSGLPDGVKVVPSSAPAIQKNQKITAINVTNCAGTGDGVWTCEVNGNIDSGNSSVVPVGIVAGSATGQFAVQAEVLSGDQSLANTEFAATVAAGTKNEVTVQLDGTPMSAYSNAESRTIRIYNLGGASESGKKITLNKVLPAGLAQGAKGAGKGWTCNSSNGRLTSCQWNGKKFGPGAMTSPLKVSYRIGKASKKGSVHQGDAQVLKWNLVTSGPTLGKEKHALSISLLDKADVPASKADPKRLGTLTTDTIVMGDPRFGGFGRFQTSVSNGGGKAVTKAQIRVVPPKSSSVVKFEKAAGWNCSVADSTCVRTGAGKIKAKEAVTPVVFLIKSSAAKRIANKNNAVRVVASWKDGSKKLVSKRTNFRTNWESPLGLSKISPSSKIMASGIGVEQSLTANVAGVDGNTEFQFAWKQICSGSCPKVKWKNQRAGSQKDPKLIATFLPPKVTGTKPLKFKLIVSEGGSTATRTISVKTRATTVKIDKKKLHTMKYGAVNTPTVVPYWDPSKNITKGKIQPVGVARIKGLGGSKVKPGKRVTLTAKMVKVTNAKKAQIQKVTWKVGGKSINKQKGVRRYQHGRIVSFIVPASVRTASLNVVATFKHPNKRTTVAAGLIESQEPKPAPYPDLNVETGDGLDGFTFCILYGAARTNTLTDLLDPGLAFVLHFDPSKVTTTGTDCSNKDAKISYTNARMSLTLSEQLKFDSLEGTITAADGILIRKGTMIMPGLAKITRIPFTADHLGIPMVAGHLAALTGTAALAALPYLPLPEGWSISPADSRLTVTPMPGSFDINMRAIARGPDNAEVIMVGKIGTDGSFRLAVQTSDVWKLTDVDGSTATFAGGGEITYNPTAGLNIDVAADLHSSTGGVFKLHNNFGVYDAWLRWTNDGLKLAAKANVKMGSNNYALNLDGTVNSLYDWRINASLDYSVNLRFIDIGNLRGSIWMEPSGNGGKLAIDVKADATVSAVPNLPLNVSVKVEKAEFHLGIFCSRTTQDAAEACEKKTTQGVIELSGIINIEGNSTAIPLHATADVNLDTLNFNLYENLTGDRHWGPDELGLTNLTFFYVTDPEHSPLANSPCITDGNREGKAVAGAVGQADLGNGMSGAATIVYNGWGGVEPDASHICIAITGVKPNAADSLLSGIPGAGYSFDGGLTLMYTTYQTKLMINGIPLDVQPNEITAVGNFKIPAYAQFLTGEDGNIDLQASMAIKLHNRSIVSARVRVALGFKDVYISGRAGEANSVRLTHVAMEIGWTEGGSWSLGAEVGARLLTGGSGTAKDGNLIASEDSGSLPAESGEEQGPTITGRIVIKPAWTIANTTLTFTAVLGMRGQANYAWNNAFGVSGLTIEEIAFEAHLETGRSYVGVAATVRAPKENTSTFGRIAKFIGLAQGARLTVVFAIGTGYFCAMVEIEAPENDPDGQAIRWGKSITASHVLMSIAPTGCKIGSVEVPAGYAFDFDGAVMGTTLKISGNIQVSSLVNGKIVAPEGEPAGKPGMKAQFHIEVGAFRFAGVTMSQTLMDISVNSWKDSFYFHFKGGMNIFGAVYVAAEGQFQFTAPSGLTPGEVKITLYGELTHDLLGIISGTTKFYFKVDYEMPLAGKGIGFFRKFKVEAQAPIGVMQIAGVDVALWFDYDNGRVVEFGASFTAFLNLLIFKVEGGVTFWYKRAGYRTSPEDTDPGDGRLWVKLHGKIRFWAFGWREIEASVSTSIPIQMEDPENAPPPPGNYIEPEGPDNPAVETDWAYGNQMFMGIGWKPNELKAAAGLDSLTQSQLNAVKAQNPELGEPEVEYLRDGGVQVGNSDSKANPDGVGPDGTYGMITGTVTLPETTTYNQMVALLDTIPEGPAKEKARANLVSQNACSGVTRDISVTNGKVDVPLAGWNGQVPSDSSHQAALVTEMNWRMYLGSVVEAQSIGSAVTAVDKVQRYKCGYDEDKWSSYSTLAAWYQNPDNTAGIQMNMGYPKAKPDTTAQFCSPGNIPNTEYGTKCRENIAAIGTAWGTGWAGYTP